MAAIPISIAARPVAEVTPFLQQARPLSQVGVNSNVGLHRVRLASSQMSRSPASPSSLAGRSFTVGVSRIAPEIGRDARGNLVGGGILFNSLG